MLLDRLFMRPSDLSRRSLANPSDDLIEALTGGESTITVSGQRVNAGTALTLAAYWCAIRNIAEDVAKLPLILYRRVEPRGKVRAYTHPLYRLLHDAPNPEMSAMAFRETILAHALGWGNGFAEIQLRGDGRPAALWLLLPDRMRVERDRRTGKLTYVYSGGERGERRIDSSQVFHLHGLGFDGLIGYSIAHLARDSIGAGLGAEKSGAAFFGNASRPGGVIEVPIPLKDGGLKLRESWERIHRGSERQHKTAVLDGGATFKPMAIPNKDAQWIEARLLTVQDMCRWLRITPHKLFDLTHGTYSNVEHLGQSYVEETLHSWFVRFEQEIARKLLRENEADLFAEHLADALLRGDTQSRYGAYAVARQWGWMSANDVRERENQNPIAGGDVYLVPMNMTPADKLGEAPAKPTDTGQKLLPEGENDDEEDENTRNDAVSLIAEAHRVPLQHAYESILHAECDKVTRAAKKSNGFAKWLREFYSEHGRHVQGKLIPVVDTFCESAWSALRLSPLPEELGPKIRQHVVDMAHRHITTSRSAELVPDLPQCVQIVDNWRTLRPKQATDDELTRLAALMRHLLSEVN
jgi:HK97 family phage portal protein